MGQASLRDQLGDQEGYEAQPSTTAGDHAGNAATFHLIEIKPKQRRLDSISHKGTSTLFLGRRWHPPGRLGKINHDLASIHVFLANKGLDSCCDFWRCHE